MIQVTLSFPTAADAADALARMAGVIAPADRPDAGQTDRPAPPPPPAVDPAAVFGVAFAAQAAAIPPAPPAAPDAPTPPTAASAPTAGIAPTAAPPAAPEYDVAGMPWDARIHSETKSKNKDGTWRQKRGVDDDVRAKIEAETRAALGLPPPAPAPAPAPAAPPMVPPAPPVTKALDAVGLTGVPDFASFMVKLAPMLHGPNAAENTKKVDESLKQLGLSAVGQLAARPDLIPALAAMVGLQL